MQVDRHGLQRQETTRSRCATICLRETEILLAETTHRVSASAPQAAKGDELEYQ
jgi:hypothetical protein